MKYKEFFFFFFPSSEARQMPRLVPMGVTYYSTYYKTSTQKDYNDPYPGEKSPFSPSITAYNEFYTNFTCESPKMDHVYPLKNST